MQLPRAIQLRLQGLAYRLSLSGIEPDRVWRTIRTYAGYRAERRRFLQMLQSGTDPLPIGMDCWCLHDRHETSGSTNTHYFHQDLLVARRIFTVKPRRHVDVGSRVDGFVSHVAAFRAIEVVDVRPQPGDLAGIRFIKADVSRELPASLVGCTDSLSCLHALEHFGLGRYGDRLDPDGHLHGLANLHAMLEPGGRLYLSVPMGPSRIEFNAHRVFSLPHLLRLMSGRFHIDRFSFVDDVGALHEDQPWTGPEADQNHGCRFGCAIIEASKVPLP
jgi:SAM-dependent methyltransferase